ncbi:hypothetical protein TWF481_000663 [Arthrobotrys musiformis]|uniref:Peptidase S8/S53 domain-containing protein n=1 Tax=Arthrobotrys musiformis TaxID=47236 RepID=A0AAV9WPF4_9PEZI
MAIKPQPLHHGWGIDIVSWDTYYQTDRNLRVSAPAVDVLVPLPSSSFYSREIGPAKAASHNPGDYATVKGTAYAAATVAGLVAYFLEMGFSREEAKIIIYAYAYPRTDREFDTRLDRAPDVIYNGIWGFCKGGKAQYGPLTRELVEIEKAELVKISRSVVQSKWPEELEWDSDDDIPDNPKRPTDPSLGDPPPGWGEGPGEETPPVYSPDDAWKRNRDPGSNDGNWPKCPVSSSLSTTTSSSIDSSSISSFATTTTITTTRTMSRTTSFSSVKATSTPADNEDEEESTPTEVTEPEEPAPTLDWADESLVGELSWVDSALLWAIPAVAAPIIIVRLPLADGGTLTSTITNANYTSYTISLKDPSKFDLKKIGISTIPGPTTNNPFVPTAATLTSTAFETPTTKERPTSPTIPEITPPPLHTAHLCKQLFFTTPKPTATAAPASDKRWILTLPVTSWYYVERNIVASAINSSEICGSDAPELKDGCHGNNPLNPWNWKGGGVRIIGGTQYYEIEPLDPYRRPPGRIWAACRFWFANGQAYAKVWGYGFLDAFDDINHNLPRPKRMGRGPVQFYNKVTQCTGWDGTWWMAPTTPIPHESALWEWVLSIGFKIGYFANRQGRESKKCLEDAIREASGITDFKCGNKEWDKGVRYFWDKDTRPNKG